MTPATVLHARLSHPASRQEALAEVQRARQDTIAMTAAALGVSRAAFEKWCAEDEELKKIVTGS